MQKLGSGATGTMARCRLVSANVDGVNTVTTGSVQIAFDSLGVPYYSASGAWNQMVSPAAIVLKSNNYKLEIDIAATTGELSVKSVP